jgi:hypothetical protein
LEQALGTYHDLAARKHNALVSPQSIHVDLAAAEPIVLDEVLHHGQALPAWNTVLARERVEIAVDVEVLRVVGAVALDADSLRAEVTERVGRVVPVLGAGTSGVLRRTEGVEDALELGAPRVDVGRVRDGEVEVLEGRLVRVVFAVEVVHDDSVGALARPAGTEAADVLTVDKGVAALPVVTDLAGGILRDLLGPPLRALVTLEGLEGRAQDFITRDEVVAPELDVLEQPGHVDVETLGTAEDRSGDVVSVSSHLRTVEAALSNVEPRVEAQKSGSEKDSDGLQERGVTDAPARPVVVAADVAEDVRLGNEVDEVTNVLGLVVEVLGALLVAEGI